jgi:ribosomal protein S12 methylthiotransferase accessory factor YcaO
VLEPLIEARPAGGSRLTGVEHLVPSVLVTDPVPEQPWSDGSPSGAASGPGWTFAAERALLESVERDAALCCWALRPRVPFVDSLDLAGRTGALGADQRADVADYLSRHRARARTVILPSDAGVRVASWVDRAGGIVGADAVAADDDGGRPTADMLIAALRVQGLRPLLADLTPRLPTPLRAAGWCSIRAIVLGHQQYRMDDTKPWSWYAPRVDNWAHRLVDPARFDPDAVGHPLI